MDSHSKSAVAMVTASGTKGKKKTGHRFDVKEAENGWSMAHHPPEKEGEPYMYSPPKEHVFSGDNAMGEMHSKMAELAGMKKKNAKSGKMKPKDTAGEKAAQVEDDDNDGE